MNHNKEKLMDYLYGEMAPDEKLAYEKLLESDAELREEWKALQRVSHFLQQSEDLEVPTRPSAGKVTKLHSGLRNWLMIAASLILLMLAAKWVGLQVEVSKQQLVVHFGTHGIPAEPAKSTQPVTDEYKEILAALTKINKRIDEKADYGDLQEVTAKVSQPAPDNRQILASLEQTLRQQQEDLSRDVSEQLQISQQVYMQELVADLIQYWDAQRIEDLDRYNNGLENLAQLIRMNANDLAQLEVPIENL